MSNSYRRYRVYELMYFAYSMGAASGLSMVALIVYSLMGYLSEPGFFFLVGVSFFCAIVALTTTFRQVKYKTDAELGDKPIYEESCPRPVSRFAIYPDKIVAIRLLLGSVEEEIIAGTDIHSVSTERHSLRLRVKVTIVDENGPRSILLNSRRPDHVVELIRMQFMGNSQRAN